MVNEGGALTVVKPETAVEPFTTEGLAAEFRQAEILTNVTRYLYDPAEPEDIVEITHPFCIVASQDCDLLWDYEAAAKDGHMLAGILLFDAEPAADARKKISGRDFWKKISGNNDERYHALSPVPAELDLLSLGLPSLVVDFKRYFTIPPAHLYRQLGRDARRRTRLLTPYMEHLQMRAGVYSSRIGLPEPHKVVTE